MVDDVVGLEHSYGCGVAIDAPGSEIPIRTLRNISLNPNFGGDPGSVLIFGQSGGGTKVGTLMTMPAVASQSSHCLSLAAGALCCQNPR